ncbi:MAG: hypothetical protein IPK73_25580 [Candidatus Obscuribacter sp.]|nr:hypothetical protein [Candidatus Obscuribacter sp.]
MNREMPWLFESNFNRPYPKESEIESIKAQKLFSFPGHSPKFNFAAMQIGFQGDPIVILDTDSNRLLSPGALLRETTVDPTIETKLLHFKDGEKLELNLATDLHCRFAQPLLSGDYLVLLRDFGTKEPNVAIATKQGTIEHKFRIHPDVEDLQVSKDGKIWVGFGDEGVFSRDPVAANIIACLDQEGRLLFPDRYYECFDCWCCSVNTVSEDTVWISTNTGRLVKINDLTIERAYERKNSISSTFCLTGNSICWAPPAKLQATLMPAMKYDFFICTSLDSAEMHFLRAVDEDGITIAHESFAARGSKMYIKADCSVYVFDLQENLPNR